MTEATGGTPAPEEYGYGPGVFLFGGFVSAIVGAIWWWVGSGRTGPMLVLGGVGAIGIGGVLMMRHGPALRLLATVGLALIIGSVEALFFVPARLVGGLVGAVGLALFLFSVGLYTRPGRTAGDNSPTRGRVPGTILLVVVSLAVPLGILALSSYFVHDDGSYVRRYGSTASVSLPDTCTVQHQSVRCPGATWSVDGRQVTGTLEGRLTELRAPGSVREPLKARHIDNVTAYVYEDRAYTPGAARDAGPLAALGRLSPWFALALPIALVLWLAMRRLTWWGDPAGAARPTRTIGR